MVFRLKKGQVYKECDTWFVTYIGYTITPLKRYAPTFINRYGHSIWCDANYVQLCWALTEATPAEAVLYGP